MPGIKTNSKLGLFQHGAELNPIILPFEAPAQPSFNSAEAGYIWSGTTRTIEDFRTSMIDPLVATAPSYVTKTNLGKDESNTYDLFEYDFNPGNAEQTILITSGVHGRETVPVYSMYRLMHYLINEPNVHPDIAYLKNKVRIKMIPCVGIWSGSQTPTKSYGNVNNVNIIRDFPYEREFQADRSPSNL